MMVSLERTTVSSRRSSGHGLVELAAVSPDDRDCSEAHA